MRTRRTTELLLLLAATPVIVLLFLMLLVNDNARIEPMSFAVPASLFASFIVAHLAARKFAPGADPGILPVAYLLSGIGICFVLRLAPDAAANQIIWLFLAIALMVATIILVPSIERIGEYKYTCLVACLILLLLPMLPGIGDEEFGSRIWLKLGVFSFQPGEIAKIFLVLFLAAYLADNREMLSTMRSSRIGFKFPDFRTLLPLLAMWVVSVLIVIFEKDLGSALLFFGVFLVMLYMCTGRLSYVIISLVLVAVAAVGLYTVFDHVQTRILIWRDPFSDPQDKGYQLVQSLFSLADGGLFGVGIGKGLCTIIPVVSSDFIFSAVGEEMGLLGASGIIMLFLLLAVRGFLTASRAKSDMAAFTAAGLTTSICLQAFVIIGGVTGLIPLTGLTLPFMSQGGSSLLSSFIIVGLLLRAGDEGTGHTAELTTTAFVRTSETTVLGRVALGRRLTAGLTVFALFFAVAIGNLTYVQMVRADELKHMSNNNHTLQRESERERGAILSSDNVVLAQSVKQAGSDSYTRVYPEGDLAPHVVGYFSQQFGSAGVESSMSTSLVGDEDFETFRDALRSMAGIHNPGNDVVLTLNSEIQRMAQDVLEGEKGACIVLDTETGAVLAEASAPSYNTNNIRTVLESDDNTGRLVNRATQLLYAPGSTFKTVTLAAALDVHEVTDETKYSSPAKLEIGGGTVTNYHNVKHGTVTVRQATAVSSNTAFAQIADELGPETLVSYADGFGFDSDDLAQDFSLKTSVMPQPQLMTEWETAWAGVGQPVGEHTTCPAGPQATVMQMAVIMAAISNDGVAMKPYVVQRVLSPNGAVVAETKAHQFGRAMSSEAAEAERDILKTVVESGSGTAAAVGGAKVIGKTGTAETSNPESDAWFVGTATAGGRSVTVAILVEKGDSGGDVAAPKASNVLYTALSELGAL